MPNIPLYTSAWFEDAEKTFDLPEHCSVDILHPVDAPPLDETSIQSRLNEAYGKNLSAMVAAKRKVTIVVDDLGRPTPAHLIIPSIIKILQDNGIKDNDIHFLIATGSHRTLTLSELEKKLGSSIPHLYATACHDAFNSPMTHLGYLPNHFPCIVNKIAAESDALIGIGSVLPHSCHGFGGGSKLFLPGIAGIESIATMHGFTKKRGRGNIEPFSSWDMRTASDFFCEKLPPIFSINVVVNSKRQICGLFAGDIRMAHEKAARFASEVYKTDINHGGGYYDIVIINSYPMDSDPVQSDKSQWAKDFFPDALLIFLNSARDGQDYHGWKQLHKETAFRRNFIKFFRSIERSSRIPRPVYFLLSRGPLRFLKKWLLKRWFLSEEFDYRHYSAARPAISKQPSSDVIVDLNSEQRPWVFSRNYPQDEFQKKYKNGTLIREWKNVFNFIDQHYKSAKIAVLTCAPLQLPHKTDSTPS